MFIKFVWFVSRYLGLIYYSIPVTPSPPTYYHYTLSTEDATDEKFDDKALWQPPQSKVGGA